MHAISDTKYHGFLLRRVFDLPENGLTADGARWLLQLDFPDGDHRRIEKLNEKANDGTLSASERAELEAYVDVGDLLAYWQSRARRLLRASNGSAP